jgi:two-component sensor histidine kinase
MGVIVAKRKATETTDAGQGTDNGQAQVGAETISGYFRRLFEENPQWLEERSNQALLDRWLKDHPGQTEVPENIKNNLSNVKSTLRKTLRKKRGRPKKTSQPVVATAAPAEAPRKSARRLEALEEQIDDCLALAKEVDRERLADVIVLLRRARNQVVWKMGE